MKKREDFPALLNTEGLTGMGVELGVKEGEYSYHLLKHWHAGELISIDIWSHQDPESYTDVANVNKQGQKDHLSATFDRLYEFGSRSTLIRATGERAVKFFADESLAFIYIDANHHYEAVKSDCHTWWPKIMKGGYLCGHDYAHPDVARAVDEFAALHGLTIFKSTDDWWSWFIKK